jgi:predicted DNA-binding WGR domain protein
VPSIYLEKVVPEKNVKRFYFISDEHQTTFVGYPVTIIFGRISERAMFVTKVFPTEARARRYFNRQMRIRQRHRYAVVKPPYLREKKNEKLIQLSLPLY